MSIFTPNILLIIVLEFINIALGALWYSKYMFGKQWLVLLGKKESDLKANANQGYAYAGIGALAAIYSTNVIANLAFGDIAHPKQGLLIGFLIGVIILYVGINNTSFTGKPWKLFLIDYGYPFIFSLVAGLAFGIWR